MTLLGVCAALHAASGNARRERFPYRRVAGIEATSLPAPLRGAPGPFWIGEVPSGVVTIRRAREAPAREVNIRLMAYILGTIPPARQLALRLLYKIHAVVAACAAEQLRLAGGGRGV